MKRISLLLLALSLHGADSSDAFFKVIEPILVRDCQGCHGGTQALSNLDLRSRERILKGGVRGPAVVPGKSSSSLLIQVLEGKGGLEMPPGGVKKRLPPEAIAAFRQWVDDGAPWPSAKPSVKWAYNETDLWAFKPPRQFDPSKRVDDFIDAKLANLGLKPAPAAGRRTLIRRVSIDLTGLPPTPEEVTAFVNDSASGAWPRLIDRLLNSPHYGERWARHWLDVTRYADSGGYSNDFERPNAWRYRDYVIRSFNSDKPYAQFVKEQIAGDELYTGNPEALIATGFLRAGPWEHTAMSVEAVTRQLFLDDVTHATASVFLGLTLGCARCHDHKFDPLPTRDYYRMQAIFSTTEFARPSLPFLPSEHHEDPRSASEIKAAFDYAKTKVNEYRQLGAKKLMEKYGVSKMEDLPKDELDTVMNTGAGIPPDKFEEFKLYQKHMQIYKDSLDRFEPKAFAVSSGPMDGETDGGPQLRYPKRAAYKSPTVHILPGGNIQLPAGGVTPGVLSLLEQYGGYPSPKVPETVEGRRGILANWIADRKNPLTARVMVNRIWQYHFGRGIAADPSNFGKMGMKPSHPELLDWLSGYFIEQGWSVKQVHRAILLSNAYQRSSSHPDAKAIQEKDSDNAALARFPVQRMDAETLRDSILQVSGELSLDAGGSGTFPQINENVAHQPQHRMGSLAPVYHASPSKRQRNRRTIYGFQQRSLIDPLIEVFNGPTLDLSCERRETSIVPTQSFALFNSQFAHDMVLAWAAKLDARKLERDATIERAFLEAYGRAPEAGELAASRAYLEKTTEWHKKTPPAAKPGHKPVIHKITSELTGHVAEFVQQGDPENYEANLHPSDVTPETRALADFMLALLNSNEFIYVY